MIDAQHLREHLQELNAKFYQDSWTHPRTLLLASVMSQEFGYGSMLEIGAWMGAVPKMLDDLARYLGHKNPRDFVLIDNFMDHERVQPCSGTVTTPEQLQQYVSNDLGPGRVQVFRDLSSLSGSFDIMHFDSVKWRTELLEQFDQVREQATPNAVFIFDDYIAEWPDVIYCVDTVQQRHALEVVASFGPKIYLSTAEVKNQVLQLCRDRRDLARSLLNVRHTIKHGEVVSSGPDLMM